MEGTEWFKMNREVCYGGRSSGKTLKTYQKEIKDLKEYNFKLKLKLEQVESREYTYKYRLDKALKFVEDHIDEDVEASTEWLNLDEKEIDELWEILVGSNTDNRKIIEGE